MIKKSFFLWRLIISALVFSVLFSSCSQEPIFYSIEREVPQRKMSVKNFVYSLVQVGNSLYAANGSIFTKDINSQSPWSKTSKPSGFIIRLAAESAWLYALNDKREVYAKNMSSGEWTKIADSGIKTIFDDGAGSAYVTKDDGAYKITTGTISGTKETGTDSNTIAAVKNSSTTYFSNTQAVAVNTTDSKMYRVSDNVLSISADNGATWAETGLKGSGISPALAYWKESGGSKYLLFGTTNSYLLAPLNTNGTVVGNLIPPGSNTLSVLGDLRIFDGGLYVFPFVKNSITTTALYAVGIYETSSDRNGLRGYYDLDGEKTWNNE